jgi:hypothetical protein
MTDTTNPELNAFSATEKDNEVQSIVGAVVLDQNSNLAIYITRYLADTGAKIEETRLVQQQFYDNETNLFTTRYRLEPIDAEKPLTNRIINELGVMKALNAELVEALEDSANSLQWRIDEVQGAVDESDYEKLAGWLSIITKAKAES